MDVKLDRGIALGTRLGLSPSQARRLASLQTPDRIQTFINRLVWNHEPDGHTARSVVGVLEAGSAQCVEGAFVAGLALWMAGEPPLLLDLGAEGDVDHVVALFRRRDHWGAISKSNSPNLRFRDPIYRSLRELAISYFPQYLKGRRKTLRTYSVPVDLRRHPPATWVTREGYCREVVDALTDARHFEILPPGAAGELRPIDDIEVQGNHLGEYPW
jgi:hypothetical protein